MKNNSTGIENLTDTDHSPKDFTLSQNFPNPFNAFTRITYYLPVSTQVSLKIFNIQGQLVRTLIDEIQIQGSHAVVWDGLADDGSVLATGIYVCQLHCMGMVKTRKMVLLK